MKKNKVKSWFLLITGILLAIIALIMLSVPDGYYATIFGLIIAAICVLIALIQLSKTRKKNTYIIEGKFLSIGKFEEFWVGCYFEIDGQEKRVAIMKDVFNPKLLMPGGQYKLTLSKKDDSVVGVERID